MARASAVVADWTPGDGSSTDRLTLADISVASPFANFRHLDIVLDPARHPKTIAWVEKILARPSFAPMLEQEARFLERTSA